MPPLGEYFRPQTELSAEEITQKAEIEAKLAEIGLAMEALTPPFGSGRKAPKGKSVIAHYEHADLPDDQVMEAYLRRNTEYRGDGEFITLYCSTSTQKKRQSCPGACN